VGPFGRRLRSSRWAVTAVWLGGILTVIGLVITSRIRFGDTKEYMAGGAMRGDLRALVEVEDQLLRDSSKYLDKVPPKLLTLTPGVGGPTMTLTSDGWTAEVRHDWSSQVCAVFVGSTPLAPAVRQREPECTPISARPSPSLIGPVLLVAGVAIGIVGGVEVIRRSVTPRAA